LPRNEHQPRLLFFSRLGLTQSRGTATRVDVFADVTLRAFERRHIRVRAAGVRLLRDTRPVPSSPPRLFDHVTVRVRDIAQSRAFYERALQPFDIKVVQSSQGPVGFTTDDRGDFWIKEQETAAGRVHIAFAAPDRATVDAFHAAAVEAGGVDNGEPGPRPHYHSTYYAAFVLDPDGNNVEAVFHGDP
jgi:catechol 2,3-dioxygenase-like lactoylglutathione lyase family enzyme